MKHYTKVPTRKRDSLFGVLLGMALAVGAMNEAAAQDRTSVTFGLPTPTTNAAYCIFPLAAEAGYFDEEKLAVEIVNVTGSTALAQLTISGSVDIGAITPEPIFAIAGSADKKLRMFYNLVRSPTGGFVTTLEDSPLNKIEDLKGKTLGAQSLGAGDIPFMNSILRGYGINPETDVQYLAVGVGSQALQALNNGYVDGLVLWDSAIAQIASTGVKLKTFTGEGVERLFSTQLAAEREWLTRNVDVAERFGRAVAKATLFASANPEACIKALWKQIPASRVQSQEESAQLQNDITIIGTRIKLMTGPVVEKNGFGFYDRDDVSAWYRYAVESDMIKDNIDDIGELYLDQLADDMNNFDKEKIVESARSWRSW